MEQTKSQDNFDKDCTQSRTVAQSNGLPVWYCPSRWLLAHHDPQANIQTTSSHMCLADLYNDGESLLALIDFKQRLLDEYQSCSPKPPYDCRMRAYRGQQLIYNHFLDDMPSCLIATSINLPDVPSQIPFDKHQHIDQLKVSAGRHQPLLTLTINDDVYFYHKLRPSHKISLEDTDFILDTLNKSEVDAWQMVKQNRVDVETMREVLNGLSQELGDQELSSHTNNFLALESNEARKQYLIAWRFKRLQNGLGEHLMSMDTICCAAARLKYNSTVTRNGDFGQTRENGTFLNNSRWNRILDIQKDGLIIGTEDRHLLVYELRSVRTRLECHFRLPSVADHILVERRSPSSFDIKSELKNLTYRVLISCRNCRIYSIDLLYLNEKKSNPGDIKELLAFKCNVFDMCWSSLDNMDNLPQGTQSNDGSDRSNFIVACLDKRVYCFNSQTGQCKWVVEVELPITGLISLPKLQIGSNESSLIGVASQANRIDFYVSSSGRIVDSIYFSRNDYPQAMIFGRFGREDNCLCLVTSLGHLLIFILKRTAKFAHGQCLSSAASYAYDALENCGRVLQRVSSRSSSSNDPQADSTRGQQQLKLSEPPNLPSAFALTKSSSNAIDQVLDSMLQSDHDCNQVKTKNALDSQLIVPRLQVPVKGRDFIDQILEQSRSSKFIGRIFAKQMSKLRDKIKTTIDQQSGLRLDSTTGEDGNRVTITQLIGLGNIYRVSLSLRLNLKHLIVSPESSKRNKKGLNDSGKFNLNKGIMVFLFTHTSNNNNCTRKCQVKPFKLLLDSPKKENDNQELRSQWLLEETIEFKLIVHDQNLELLEGDSISLDIYALIRTTTNLHRMLQRPIFVSSISVPTC